MLVLALLACLFVGSLSQSAALVPVQLYYESCCPYCEEWIEGTFKTAFYTSDFQDITNITFFPYGNAHEVYSSATGEWEFTCQHGVNECKGNLVEVKFFYKKYPKSKRC